MESTSVKERVDIDESPKRRAGKPGSGSLDLSDWDPPEAARLRGALALLKFVAFGSSGSPGIRDRASGASGEWTSVDPDKRRTDYRLALRRLLGDADRLATHVISSVRWGKPIFELCRRCKTDLRAEAKYCDRCGASQKRRDPEVAH